MIQGVFLLVTLFRGDQIHTVTYFTVTPVLVLYVNKKKVFVDNILALVLIIPLIHSKSDCWSTSKKFNLNFWFFIKTIEDTNNVCKKIYICMRSERASSMNSESASSMSSESTDTWISAWAVKVLVAWAMKVLVAWPVKVLVAWAVKVLIHEYLHEQWTC